MIEVVKEINGYQVQRYKGRKGQYFVNIKEGKGFKEFHTFGTMKSAVEFIKSLGA